MVHFYWLEKCCLGLRVCLGCHVGPSILMVARAWSVFVPWIQRYVFSPFLLRFLHNTIFQGTCGIDIILNKYTWKKY
jgi:hypothetical protein